MKFCDSTIQVLKNFSSINSCILIQPGNVISTKSADNTVLAVAEVPETFEQAIAIFDLPQFLNVWGMFQSPDLQIVSGKQAKIVEDRTVARYTFAEPSLIPSAPQGVKESETVASFNLKSDQLQRLLKSGAAMGLQDIVIKGNGEHLIISAITLKSVSSNSLDITVGETDATFSVHLQASYMMQIPKNYKITITQRFTKFEADCEGTSLPRLTYWVGNEHDSRFE